MMRFRLPLVVIVLLQASVAVCVSLPSLRDVRLHHD
jgi:hypothetical protein